MEETDTPDITYHGLDELTGVLESHPVEEHPRLFAPLIDALEAQLAQNQL